LTTNMLSQIISNLTSIAINDERVVFSHLSILMEISSKNLI
jgi:hypothetical protein